MYTNVRIIIHIRFVMEALLPMHRCNNDRRTQKHTHTQTDTQLSRKYYTLDTKQGELK